MKMIIIFALRGDMEYTSSHRFCSVIFGRDFDRFGFNEVEINFILEFLEESFFGGGITVNLCLLKGLITEILTA